MSKLANSLLLTGLAVLVIYLGSLTRSYIAFGGEHMLAMALITTSVYFFVRKENEDAWRIKRNSFWNG